MGKLYQFRLFEGYRHKRQSKLSMSGKLRQRPRVIPIYKKNCILTLNVHVFGLRVLRKNPHRHRGARCKLHTEKAPSCNKAPQTFTHKHCITVAAKANS